MDGLVAVVDAFTPILTFNFHSVEIDIACGRVAASRLPEDLRMVTLMTTMMMMVLTMMMTMTQDARTPALPRLPAPPHTGTAGPPREPYQSLSFGVFWLSVLNRVHRP